jgi:hypothetical protein
VGHALERLPQLAQAFRGGELSLDKVRALTRVATPADEEIWVEVARQATGSQLARICREHRRALEAEAPEVAERQLARRGLWAHDEEDGSLRLEALLAPEDGAVVLAALEAVVNARPRPRAVAEEPAAAAEEQQPVKDPAEDCWAARRADALVALCEQALAIAPEELMEASKPPQLVVHVDLGVLSGEEAAGRCHLEAGPAVSSEVARRLGCDAETVAVLEREGMAVEAGRSRRIVSRRLRRALWGRDGSCRFPGCGVPARRTQAHHIQHWAQGGGTDLGNLVSLCWFHHRRLHDGAYRLQRDALSGLRFLGADGRVIGPQRRPLGRPAGSAHLRELHAAEGRRFDAFTAAAKDGSRIQDMGHVTWVLLDAVGHARRRAGPPG